jgi:arylsulfatase A-like enzyme
VGVGQRDYTTPNIDQRAIEGSRFTQACANFPVCSATPVALSTGRHPTLPSLLKKAGYGTAPVGKWHFGYGRISVH